MSPRTRRIFGGLMMVVGPALILLSPWLVLSFGPIRERVYDQGWALLPTRHCVWFSELRESAAIVWLCGIIVFGVVALFAGLRIFRSSAAYTIHS